MAALVGTSLAAAALAAGAYSRLPVANDGPVTRSAHATQSVTAPTQIPRTLVARPWAEPPVHAAHTNAATATAEQVESTSTIAAAAIDTSAQVSEQPVPPRRIAPRKAARLQARKAARIVRLDRPIRYVALHAFGQRSWGRSRPTTPPPLVLSKQASTPTEEPIEFSLASRGSW